MRNAILLFLVLFLFSWQNAKCQIVRVQLAHPKSSFSQAYQRPPFRGAIWILPEWKWTNGAYVSMPGYWTRPHRKGLVWVPGRWIRFQNGYRWTLGRWK